MPSTHFFLIICDLFFRGDLPVPTNVERYDILGLI